MVRRGKAWGSLVFASNYTDSLVERTENGRYTDDATVESSDLNVRLDMSSKWKFYNLIKIVLIIFLCFRSTNIYLTLS